MFSTFDSDMSGIQYRVLNKRKGPAVWVGGLLACFEVVSSCYEYITAGLEGTDRQRPVP